MFPHQSIFFFGFCLLLLNVCWNAITRVVPLLFFKGTTHAYLDLKSIMVNAYLYPVSFFSSIKLADGSAFNCFGMDLSPFKLCVYRFMKFIS